MSATNAGRRLAGYRDKVAQLIRAGQPFDQIEQTIDDAPDLTTDQRDSLWLFAFSLCDLDRGRPYREAPGRVAVFH